MYVDIRGVGSKSHRATPSRCRSSTGAGVGELDTTSQSAGATTVKVNVALRSGCSKQAYMRRASAISNWV